MKMNKKEGFTLIEMLVVIAMIGLLSAVVLVALGPSRNKAKDTRIISDVNQIRALAETYYNPVTGAYDVGSLRSAASSTFTDISNQIGNQNGLDTDYGTMPTSGTTATSVAVYAKLVTTNVFYCVDSIGNTSSSMAKAPAGDSCQ